MPGWRTGQNGKNGRAWETHDPDTQPNPACGLGLCQQQKNNTLPRKPGTMAVHAFPLLQLATLCIKFVQVLQALCSRELPGAFRASSLPPGATFLVNLALP